MSEQIAVVVEQLNFAFLLITHMVCADQQIHSEEAQALQELAKRSKIGERTIEEMEKILAQDEDYLSVDDVARQIPLSGQSEAMRQVLAVAYIDGFFSAIERAMVDEIAEIWNWSNGEIETLIEQAQGFSKINKSSEEKEVTKLSFGARLLKGADSILSRALVDSVAKIAPENIGRQIQQSRQEILLSGEEYKGSVEECAAIASEDYKYAELALKGTGSTLHNLGKGIQEQLTAIQHQANGKGQAKTAAEVAKQLEATRKALTVEIIKEMESVRQSLSAKERALNHFSIAFMGKTKAGKSTLHAIITGGGWEAIGVGKQRTTRFNRVYEWRNIRIIDTPGIGAPGGKTDEEIAESVIEESDVICYVVTNDSIQETEFKFLQLLKEKAKPLIILLNVKNNLRDSRRLEHFLANPEKLFAVDGQSNLGGHIERIRRYAKQNYANDYFEIIPVMLLAAQMSREPEHEEIKDQLFQASQMQKFLDSIRLSLVDYGKIRRSQTLLGSTVSAIDDPNQWIKKQLLVYEKLGETLKEKQKHICKDIHKFTKSHQQSLLQEIESIFQDASNPVASFSEEHWDSTESRLNQGWERNLKNIRFDERLTNVFHESIENFNKDIQELLEEIGNEIKFMSQLGGGYFRFTQQDSNNFHDFFRYSGLILTIAGAILIPFVPPVGIAVGIIAGVFSTLTGFFKSKSEKRREAVQKISKSLLEQININKQNTQQKAKNDLIQYTANVSTSLDNYFNNLIQGIETIVRELKIAQHKLDDNYNYLNRAYAKRIIDWVINKYETLTDEGIINTIAKVDRDFGKSMKIYTKAKLTLRKSSKDINRIIQEDISIQSSEQI
ncbi:50S ribosome-binding GTPase [Nostoc sp. FACHB-87]|uniref:GTPase n=1 Tax=Nostocaceae TaxID=1162 RepID=UPI00168532E9|nr:MULTISPECIES: GTPase [Nostocaceae]MBD2458702.1 50S ribosome-binding GTPase [Nostoc sp. FACHB-87]MBD2478180.1 50S ribosome-binding GTPase [Anabaena sp. FACHB-83]